jgi:hypothetical protein
MSKKVADVLWEMLAKAGVKRCYGIVGDALNPVVDALRRNGAIEFVPVRHEEYGVFAAVAEAYFTGNPVVVCGTAGPGVVHVFQDEPRLHPEYISLKNTFLLPHIGSATIETRTAMGMLALDNVEAVLNGRPAPTLVPGRSRESSELHSQREYGSMRARNDIAGLA